MVGGDRSAGDAEAASGWRADVASRLSSTNAAGLLYGGIVTAATIAVVASHAERGLGVLAAVGGVLATYWLAHVYVRALSDRLQAGEHRLPHHLRLAARHESTVLLGGLPALAIFTVEVLVGVDVEVAGDVALWVSVLLLAGVGYLAAHAAGVRGRALAAETAIAGLFGVFAVVLKGLLH